MNQPRGRDVAARAATVHGECGTALLGLASVREPRAGGYMESAEILNEVRAALGVGDLAPLAGGAQKLVFRSELEGVAVAVKVVLIPDTVQGAEVVERARREVELLSTVDSPHVVCVLSEAVEIGDRPEAICWAEEMLDGEDLRDLAKTFPWRPYDVEKLVRDVASGLAACHELDVVHRDLSPGNIRRRASGDFVVMDPGFARHLSKAAITGVYQPGTRNYISPEHLPGGHPLPASDVFGVGILAYQALTGVAPIVYGGDDGEYFEKLRNSQAVSIRSVRDDVPEALARVIDTCLQRQPARRYIDAGELLGGLSDPLNVGGAW